LVICPMVQNDHQMLAGIPGARWDVLQDHMDDDSVMRRLGDYLKLVNSGAVDYWRTRQGVYMGGFGPLRGQEYLDAYRMSGNFRLFPAASGEILNHVVGESLP